MKLAIMQPYLFPYIGYFQLINAVDVFVIYDNIEFTKKGWFHRNRILSDCQSAMFSLPLKKDSDFLNVNQRFIGDNSLKQRKKILNRIKNDYQNAPYFAKVYPLVEKIILSEEHNLFNVIFDSIKRVLTYLKISTRIVVSSTIKINHGLRGEDKVLAICNAMQCSEYINAIGGQQLYCKEKFKKEEINLSFLQSGDIVYKQFENDFVPWLSIIDVMMFNSVEQINRHLKNYVLI